MFKKDDSDPITQKYIGLLSRADVWLFWGVLCYASYAFIVLYSKSFLISIGFISPVLLVLAVLGLIVLALNIALGTVQKISVDILERYLKIKDSTRSALFQAWCFSLGWWFAKLSIMIFSGYLYAHMQLPHPLDPMYMPD